MLRLFLNACASWGIFRGQRHTALQTVSKRNDDANTSGSYAGGKKGIKENVTIMVGQCMEARDKLLLLVLWKSGKSWCYKYIHLLLMEYAANKRMW